MMYPHFRSHELYGELWDVSVSCVVEASRTFRWLDVQNMKLGEKPRLLSLSWWLMIFYVNHICSGLFFVFKTKKMPGGLFPISHTLSHTLCREKEGTLFAASKLVYTPLFFLAVSGFVYAIRFQVLHVCLFLSFSRRKPALQALASRSRPT